jgi:hypothetical protein
LIYGVPFEAKHLAQMRVQKAQAWLSGVTEQDVKGLEGPYAGTLMRDGKPLACAGALEYWPGRALVWCWLSEDVDAAVFPALHREAKRFLDGLPIRRLEASVDVPFKNGHRWLRALGFHIETPLQRYFQPNGADSMGYVRLKV